MTPKLDATPTPPPADKYGPDFETPVLPQMAERDSFEAIFALFAVIGTLYAAYRFLLPFASI